MLDNETNTGIIKGPGRIVVHSGGVLKKGVVDESAGSVNVESSGGSSPPPSSEFSGGCSAGLFGIGGLFAVLAVAGRRRFFHRM
jgi:hypothetical protein